MRSTIVLLVALASLAGVFCGFARADEPPVGAAASASRDARPEKPESSKLPADSTTAFTLNVDDRSLAFHVTAGSLQLKDEAGPRRRSSPTSPTSSTAPTRSAGR